MERRTFFQAVGAFFVTPFWGVKQKTVEIFKKLPGKIGIARWRKLTPPVPIVYEKESLQQSAIAVVEMLRPARSTTVNIANDLEFAKAVTDATGEDFESFNQRLRS